MYNLSNTRKAFVDLFDKILKWKDIPSGKTRKNDSDGNLENTLSSEANKIPVKIKSTPKETSPHYVDKVEIEIDFSKISPMYNGSVKNKQGQTEMEEELSTVIKAYFEHKYDEWRDSP